MHRRRISLCEQAGTENENYMNNYVIYLVPAFGIIGMLVMAYKSAWVGKQDAGDENDAVLAPGEAAREFQPDATGGACNEDCG